MRIWRGLGLALAVWQLSGCVSVRQTVALDAAPASKSGYIAGSFSTNKGTGFGFGIVNTVSGEDYVMPFGRETILPSERNNQIGMIEVPPGEYKIAYWTTYSTMTKERMSRKDIDHPVLSSPFTVALGSVVFLGSYSATTEHRQEYRTHHIFWEIQPQRISTEEARGVFNKDYPKFSDMPFSCQHCVAY